MYFDFFVRPVIGSKQFKNKLKQGVLRSESASFVDQSEGIVSDERL